MNHAAKRRKNGPRLFNGPGEESSKPAEEEEADGRCRNRNRAVQQPSRKLLVGDARDLQHLRDPAGRAQRIDDKAVDLILTSPPYWRKRDYGIANQIGQEETPEAYVSQILNALAEWRRVLRPTGSVFLNIGDTYWRKSLAGIPGMIESGARASGFVLRNRIVWIKRTGHPDPARDRLASRHEYVLHFALNGYYYDLFGYAQEYSLDKRGANPGDVWEIPRKRDLGGHLAPFPSEIARRAILLACPELVCTKCGVPRRRHVVRTMDELNVSRPQARRALEIAKQHNLTPKHFAAIRATGISDAGKARRVQSGTDKNSLEVQRLAHEAKKILGGYFREFTFTKQKQAGWEECDCAAAFTPGVVCDPFMGTATTLKVAAELGRSAIGIDLDLSELKAAAQ